MAFFARFRCPQLVEMSWSIGTYIHLRITLLKLINVCRMEVGSQTDTWCRTSDMDLASEMFFAKYP